MVILFLTIFTVTDTKRISNWFFMQTNIRKHDKHLNCYAFLLYIISVLSFVIFPIFQTFPRLSHFHLVPVFHLLRLSLLQLGYSWRSILSTLYDMLMLLVRFMLNLKISCWKYKCAYQKFHDVIYLNYPMA